MRIFAIRACCLIGLTSAALTLTPVHALESDEVSRAYLQNKPLFHVSVGSVIGEGGVVGNRSSGSLLGIDSIPNFSGYFYNPGLDGNGFPQFTWQYTMVGKSPFRQNDDERSAGLFNRAAWGSDDRTGNVTRINAPIVPVTMDLRNFDGSPRFVNGKRLISSPAAFVGPTLASPLFQETGWTSSHTPTQFTDALMRAQFNRVADPDWHTLLVPSVKQGRTMVLNRGTYLFALNADGSCCFFILADGRAFVNALFPFTPGDTGSVMGQAEVAGDITTKDISTFLFPNTILYLHGNPADCCAAGFHNYDLEPGDASNGFRERRYVMNYSTWISPGVGPEDGVVDVWALSHELAEIFSDPFIANRTPWWLGPNGNCQNDLETGDVLEFSPGANKTVFVGGTAYHVQNEALLQWFAGETPSSAINGQYSYPDPILKSASVPQKRFCAP